MDSFSSPEPWMPFDSLENIAKELNPVDFASGLYDSAVRQPVNAVRQLAGAHIELADHHDDTLATQAGNLAGFVLDYTLLNKVTGGVLNRYMGAEAAASISGASAKMFVSGALYGSLLTPSDPRKSLFETRLENGLVSGASFAVMGGISQRLDTTELIKNSALENTILKNAIAGGAGGFVESYGSIAANEHRVASINEAAKGAANYAIFGGAFGALDLGLTKGIKAAEEPVRSKYYDARWRLSENQKLAKQHTYQFLNDHNLRHPVRRFQNWVNPIELPPETRPALTEKNNPIAQFEQALPRYFSDIDAAEQRVQEAPSNKERWEKIEEQKQVRIEFGHKLLQLWHGTAEQPGIAQFSDAELATNNFPAERVAQIRTALQTPTKDGKFTQALADLLGKDIFIDRWGHHDLMDGIAYGKARFFNYDDNELMKRMSMPRLHAWRDHEYGTPTSWMPFEPTDKLPNLFHGTVNKSLPSILTERAMYPARELRLRGIEQSTGESADEQFGRRSVSLTRDFNEAWAYHRHSPDYLGTYPVVFGISRSVVPRMTPAGMLEPGELLIDKVNVGENWLTRLGFKKPELTHIYVPDSRVDSVNRMLQQHRIRGVNVMGLSEIPTPQWNEEPMPLADDLEYALQ